jgi:hypothetical protein
MLECLHLRPELWAFETALRERAEAIAGLDDERFVRVRGVHREPHGLVVVSELVAGQRLVDILETRQGDDSAAFGIDAALGFLLRALPALATLHAVSIAHGALGPGRIIVTPASQVVLLDGIYAAALERLNLSRRALWSTLGILALPFAGASRFDAHSDIMQTALCAASLALGRHTDEIPSQPGLSSLVQEVTELAEIRAGARFAQGVREFFTTALPVNGRPLDISTDAAATIVQRLAGLIGEEEAHAAFETLTRFDAIAYRVPVVAEAEGRELANAPAATAAPAQPKKSAPPTPAQHRASAPAPTPAAAKPAPPPAPTPAAAKPAPPPAPAPAATKPAPPPAPAPVAAKPAGPAAPPPAVTMQPPAPATRVAASSTAAAVSVTPALAPPPPAAAAVVAATVAPVVTAVPAAPADPIPAPAPVVSAVPPVIHPPAAVTVAPPAAAPPPVAAPVWNAAPMPSVAAPPVIAPPRTIAPAVAAPPPALAPQPIVVQQSVPIALAPAPQLRVRAEPPPGYAPQADASPLPRALPFVDRTVPEEPRQFPWKVAAAAVLVLAGGAFAGRTYLQEDQKPAPQVVTATAEPAAAAGVAPAIGKTGSLSIESQPAGAKVLMDGAEVGVTPLTLESVSPGRHAITITNGTATVRRTVRIDAGRAASLDIPIYSGWVAVFSPIPLDIAEGGATLGNTDTGKIMLTPGRHVLTLSNREFGFSENRAVEIHPGEERPLNIEPKGLVNVNAHPWAEVLIDGKKAGDRR